MSRSPGAIAAGRRTLNGMSTFALSAKDGGLLMAGGRQAEYQNLDLHTRSEERRSV